MNCICGCLGDGDELITPVYIPPTRPPWTSVDYDDEDDNRNNRKYIGRLCRGQNDEEDCSPIGSSGDGDQFLPGSGNILISKCSRRECYTCCAVSKTLYFNTV